MTRYPKDHKEQSRRRIIEVAGRQFKANGIDGSGVSGLMKEAGLTGGTFYAHFSSKTELVAIALADQQRALHEKLMAHADPGAAGLEQIVRFYLSAEHRDDPDSCPNAALLDEVARCSNDVRQAYTDGLLPVIDGLAERMSDEDPSAARVKAMSLLGMLAGTLQLARAITDPALSDELLEQGVRNALALIRTSPPT